MPSLRFCGQDGGHNSPTLALTAAGGVRQVIFSTASSCPGSCGVEVSRGKVRNKAQAPVESHDQYQICLAAGLEGLQIAVLIQKRCLTNSYPHRLIRRLLPSNSPASHSPSYRPGGIARDRPKPSCSFSMSTCRTMSLPSMNPGGDLYP